MSTTDGVDTDHAYYLEMRDRIGFDFDSRGQSERGAPSWQPGVSMLYTDEQHGFGNTGVDNPPAQTLVDAAPTPGSDSPNLDDAAFTVSRSSFDGCTHVDNYSDPDGPEGNWKLPDAVKLNVLSVDGLSPDGVAPADAPTATVVLDVLPDCGLEILAPELAIADGYEEPDTDGRYTLPWTLSLIHISELTRSRRISYAVLCLKKNTYLLYTSPILRDRQQTRMPSSA